MTYNGYSILGEHRIRFSVTEDGDLDENEDVNYMDDRFVIVDEAGNELEWFSSVKEAQAYIKSRRLEFRRILNERKVPFLETA